MRHQHNELELHSLMISANVIILELMVIGNTVGRISSGKVYVSGVLWLLCSFEVHMIMLHLMRFLFIFKG